MYTPQNGICFTLKNNSLPKESCDNFDYKPTDPPGKAIEILAATREGDYFPVVSKNSALIVAFRYQKLLGVGAVPDSPIGTIGTCLGPRA